MPGSPTAARKFPPPARGCQELARQGGSRDAQQVSVPQHAAAPFWGRAPGGQGDPGRATTLAGSPSVGDAVAQGASGGLLLHCQRLGLQAGAAPQTQGEVLVS